MENFYKLLYPMRVCLIGASHNGIDNFMPASWTYPLSASPPIFGVAIAKARYTFDLMKSSGFFTINVPGFDMKDKLEKFGRLSGRDGDKFKAWGVTKEKCEIPSVAIAEALYTIECKIVNEIEVGDHIIFAGEVVNVKKRREGKGIYQSKNGFLEI
ncbi:MAG: flavin reductase family protein [Candidatus Micrarchaeota archaeon]